MNKRLYIVVEGQTEEEFVKELLARYLMKIGIFSFPVIIHTSKGHKGGFVNYQHLKNDVKRLLQSQGQDVVVSTFVDFFRCPELPGKENWKHIPDHTDQVEKMEQAMARDINDRRFVPYIQLHEFEALLFSSKKGFENYFDRKSVSELQDIIRQYNNPEEINSTPSGAPSKRILRIVKEYDKVMFGNIIALEIGLQTILEKCPRFRNWVNKLIIECTE